MGRGFAVVRFVSSMLRRWRRAYFAMRLRRRASAKDLNPNTGVYIERPRISAVVQLFNKKDNIAAILATLQTVGIEEIVVVDDGSSDGAMEILPALLTGKNHFLIRSNDLFEVRTYSRALDFCRGEIVVLLQDDDYPPPEPGWVSAALDLFRCYPKLAILGGHCGLALLPRDPPKENGDDRAGDDQLIDQPGIARYRVKTFPPGTEADGLFTFVEVVNRAPMFVLRSALASLGGIDQVFAPFQCDDVDLCLRAWRAGYQVGLYQTDFVRDVGVGGMRLFNADAVPRQAVKNWRLIYERYGDEIALGQFAERVRQARAEAAETAARPDPRKHVALLA